MNQYYSLNLAHKNNLKKYVLQNVMLRTSTIKIDKTSYSMHKNVFLSSPFHYKTVKSHLSIPTLRIKVQFPYKKLTKIPFLGKQTAIEEVILYHVKI